MFDHLDCVPQTGNPQFSGFAKRDLEFGLTEEQLIMYHEKGFVVLKGVLSLDDVEIYRKALDRSLENALSRDKEIGRDPKNNIRYEISKDAEGKDIVWKIDPFSGLCPILGALPRDKRILDAVSSIYEGHEPALFKDKLIIKPAGTHGNHLHQDYNWWQGFPKSLLSVTIPLDATNRENGCTELYTGHKRGFIHDTDSDFSQLDQKKVEYEEHHYLELELGDVAIFSCFTPHASGSNTSVSNRRVFFLSYNDSRDGEFYQAHYQHMRWYRTKVMGEEEKSKCYYI